MANSHFHGGDTIEVAVGHIFFSSLLEIHIQVSQPIQYHGIYSIVDRIKVCHTGGWSSKLGGGSECFTLFINIIQLFF